MNRGVIKAYIIKELSELFRSKIIIMVYLMPSMVMFLFGNGIKMEVKNADTVILDHDRSKLSLQMISKFEHSKYFNTKVLNITEKEAIDRMKRGEISILIIIPEGFERKVLKNQKTEIGVFVDAAFPMRGMTMESYVEGVLYQIMEETAREKISLVKINQRNLFNQAMRDEDAIVPGLFGIILLVAPAILSALLIVKEKETGTIFNFYSSPVKKIDFLVAKLTPVFFLHSINIFILFLWATYVFNVPFRGNFLIFWLVSEIYIIISLSIGLLVSIVTRTQIVALLAVIIITIIPGFLYSGIMMPISSMKGEAYIEAHLFPVMYYNHIIYDTFLIGQGFSSPKNVLYLIILIFYGLTLLIVGSLLMKKEMR
ncbi:MAG TPA: ABC transporter permease [Persephonella sp.]|uniref:Multidrug ABC transporter n=1 Tax=Persephonella marina (strain DSM 14350 / EX-H1) TaxID=123214 RepID=C0QPK1_PERMH|nr:MULTISPECIES: ABC transporter permease [Persephonella]ACO03148.1 multidrug ABC transporter [Persephonella marina EX-H1]HCB69788.1 ABC transporter permease [Persephonella sp.]